jgi:hypothetical protein
MARRLKIKECADLACPATFSGRGLYCEFHRAGRDKPGSKFRRERNRQAQQRRRDADLRREYPLGPRTASSPRDVDPGTTLSSPLHRPGASPQVRGSQPARHNGHLGQGVSPIDVTGTPGMTVTDALDDFLAAWGCDLTGGGQRG